MGKSCKFVGEAVYYAGTRGENLPGQSWYRALSAVYDDVFIADEKTGLVGDRLRCVVSKL